MISESFYKPWERPLPFLSERHFDAVAVDTQMTVLILFCLRFAIGYDLDLDLNLSFTREGDEAKEDGQGTGDKTQHKSNHIILISCIHFECIVISIYIGKYHILFHTAAFLTETNEVQATRSPSKLKIKKKKVTIGVFL